MLRCSKRFLHKCKAKYIAVKDTFNQNFKQFKNLKFMKNMLLSL